MKPLSICLLIWALVGCWSPAEARVWKVKQGGTPGADCDGTDLPDMLAWEGGQAWRRNLGLSRRLQAVPSLRQVQFLGHNLEGEVPGREL